MADTTLLNQKNQTLGGGYDKHIKNIEYPANRENNHFVKFYINVDQESRIVRENKVKITGDVDNTDQNRANRGLGSKARFEAGVGAAVGIAAAVTVSKVVTAYKNPKSGLGNLTGFLGKSGKLGGAIAGIGLLGTGVLATAAGAGVASFAANTFDVTKKLKRLAASISLYMPSNIQATSKMNYSETDAVLVDLMQTDRGSEMFDNLMGNNTKDGAGLSSSVTRVLGTIASPNVLGLITRTAKNPKKDFLFREVDHRTFAFDYQFTPKSSDEAQDVADIIYMFKFFSHPEIIQNLENFLYLYPAEFDIEYGIQDKTTEGANGTIKSGTNSYLNKISSCVLETISVNYAPHGSFQSLRNGEPIQTNMSLVFREIEQLTQGRIEQGY